MTGFEPAPSRPPAERATELRYIPKWLSSRNLLISRFLILFSNVKQDSPVNFTFYVLFCRDDHALSVTTSTPPAWRANRATLHPENEIFSIEDSKIENKYNCIIFLIIILKTYFLSGQQ